MWPRCAQPSWIAPRARWGWRRCISWATATSGMVGSPDNQHPAALVQAPVDRVAGQVAALIRALRPQVVLTFGPYGGYGHPDHIAIHHATLAAFAAAGDPARYPEQLAAGLAPWSPSRLYYPTFGTRLPRAALTAMRLTGRDPRRIGENRDIDMLRAVEEATAITTVVDAGAYLDLKERAWRCHRSQLGGMAGMPKMPRPLRRWLSRDSLYADHPGLAGRPARARSVCGDISAVRVRGQLPESN